MSKQPFPLRRPSHPALSGQAPAPFRSIRLRTDAAGSPAHQEIHRRIDGRLRSAGLAHRLERDGGHGSPFVAILFFSQLPAEASQEQLARVAGSPHLPLLIIDDRALTGTADMPASRRLDMYQRLGHRVLHPEGNLESALLDGLHAFYDGCAEGRTSALLSTPSRPPPGA